MGVVNVVNQLALFVRLGFKRSQLAVEVYVVDTQLTQIAGQPFPICLVCRLKYVIRHILGVNRVFVGRYGKRKRRSACFCAV